MYINDQHEKTFNFFSDFASLRIHSLRSVTLDAETDLLQALEN